LTGRSDGAALDPVGDPLGLASELASRIDAWARARGREIAVDAHVCLFGRAGSAGFTRRGQVSAGGACRLLEADDGWLAVNLARTDDIELLPAWLDVAVPVDDPWPSVAAAVANASAVALVGSAAVLGMPVARLGERSLADAPAVRRFGGGRRSPLDDVGLVVDLSAMWAGPLCARLLGLAGGRVVKVEAADRLDGLRGGDAPFYDWLHAGHESVVLDWHSVGGRRDLERLLAAADVVVDASRPRAFAQLGLDLHELVTARGATWLSLTGHGRDEPYRDRVAFGDDAAVAGGLVAWDGDQPVFCADAIADPLSGMTAAAAVLDALDAGGGCRVEVAMASVAAEAAARPAPEPRRARVVEPPPSLPACGVAPPPGEHNDAVLLGLAAS
jgi:hypothetical protein